MNLGGLNMRLFLMIFLTSSSLIFADSGTLIYQAGGVAYVFPWRLCLIISGAISLGVYLLRK